MVLVFMCKQKYTESSLGCYSVCTQHVDNSVTKYHYRNTEIKRSSIWTNFKNLRDRESKINRQWVKGKRKLTSYAVQDIYTGLPLTHSKRVVLDYSKGFDGDICYVGCMFLPLNFKF